MPSKTVKSGKVYDEDHDPSISAGRGNVSNVPAEQLERIPTSADAYPDGHPSKASTASELQDADNAGGVSDTGKVDASEGNVSRLGKGFTGTGDVAAAVTGNPLQKLTLLISRNKKKSIVGVIASFIVGVAIFIMSIAQGPMQLIHLGQILGKNFAGQEDASAKRFQGLFRYARTGDFGQTRVGYFGSKTVEKTIGQLKEIGIEFPDRTQLGRFNTMTIDISADGSPYKNMSEQKARAQIISDFNLPDEGKALAKQGGVFSFNVDPTTTEGINFSKALSKTSVGALGDGEILTALKTRILARYFGLPNLWSPISARGAAAAEKLTSQSERKKAVEDRAKPRLEKSESRMSAARSGLQDKLGGKTGLFVQGVLTGAAGICLLRDAADDAMALNRGIVLTSDIEAADKIAVSAQTQSNKNITAGQIGAESESLVDDKGKSVFDAKALDATERGGPGEGEDIPGAYAQAFSSKNSARALKDDIKLEAVGVDITEVTCSTPGLIIQGVANIGLLILAAPTGGASLAVYVGKQTAGMATTTAIAVLLQQKLTDILSSDEAIVPIPPAGPLGGNILAYAGRDLANMSYISSGAVAFDPVESAQLDRQMEEKNQADFRSKNLFARIFDVHDYRSLASKTIDRTNTDPTQNISNLASTLTDFIHIGPKLASSLTPKVNAQSNQAYYDWPFPRYGIPNRLMNDPDLKDPYENADKVVAIMAENGEYAERAKKCFGVEIDGGANGLDAVAKKDVDPTSDEYLDSNCNHTDAPNWRRVIMFIFDTRTVAAAQCYDGDDEACKAVGMDQGGSGGADEGGSESPSVTIDMETLYDPSEDIACADGTKDIGVQDGYTDGKKVKVRVCALKDVAETGDTSPLPGADGKLLVNSRLSAFYVKLIEDARADGTSGITAAEGFRTMARQQELKAQYGDDAATPGYSNHQMGLAVDWGDSMIGWLNSNGNKYGLKALVSGEPWHWSPTGY